MLSKTNVPQKERSVGRVKNLTSEQSSAAQGPYGHLVGPRIPWQRTQPRTALWRLASTPGPTKAEPPTPEASQVACVGGSWPPTSEGTHQAPAGEGRPAANSWDSHLSLCGPDPNSREGNRRWANGGGHPAWGWPPTPTCFLGSLQQLIN